MIERTDAIRHRRALIVVAVLVVWSLVWSPELSRRAAAQATPEATPGQAVRLGCEIEPITPQILVGALEAATPRPLETLTLDTVPTGEPVAAAIREQIAVTVETALACRNAGDFPRAYALFTDRMLGQLFGGLDTVPPEIVQALVEEPRQVRRRLRVELVDLSEASLLPDGRVGAVVVTANATHTFTDYLFFTEAGGRWLIDEAIVISLAASDATPVP